MTRTPPKSEPLPWGPLPRQLLSSPQCTRYLLITLQLDAWHDQCEDGAVHDSSTDEQLRASAGQQLLVAPVLYRSNHKGHSHSQSACATLLRSNITLQSFKAATQAKYSLPHFQQS